VFSTNYEVSCCITDRNTVVERDEERNRVSAKGISQFCTFAEIIREGPTISLGSPFFESKIHKPDSKLVRSCEEQMRSRLLRACIPVLVLYLDYINHITDCNLRVTHRKYDKYHERDNSYGS
jgi:hypothetical protein